MSEQKETYTIEEARQKILEEKQTRGRLCEMKISAVLREFNCSLVAVVTAGGQELRVPIEIVPN